MAPELCRGAHMQNWNSISDWHVIARSMNKPLITDWADTRNAI